jgi:glycosyltransferase involved in cell wall biosynthesis
MNRPLVSVIIPVYNGEHYLSFAIRSVLQQDYYPFEFIVVDDGSTDNSGNIARSFKEVHYIYQPNQGVAVARNVGVTAAQGEFIAFLDQDDLWTADKLSTQISYLLKYPQISYTIVHQRFFLEPETVLPPWFKRDLLLKEHPAFVLSALVVRKSVFERVGNFDPSYNIGSDSEWFARTKDLNISMAIQTETLLLKRIHSHNNLQAQVALSELLRVVKASIDRKRNQKTKVNNMKSNDGEK